MNYAGPFEFSQSGDAPAEPTAGGGGIGHTFSAHTAGSAIVVQDANLLFSGDYKRSGVDLVLSKDGHEHVVSDYFKGSLRAALSSPDGAQLSGDLVTALVGEVQVAQLGGGANAAAQVIGTVSKLAGSATAIRNGVSVMLNVGDQVQKGDVVQAGADSSLTMTFIDGTVFGLSANARMVLNEMVYDPQGSANSSLLSLVQGTITFVAGETAKHGNMRVDTPVATMGIRGTAVLVEIGFEVPGQGGAPPVKFQVLVEPNGATGSYVLYSKTSGQAIGTVNAAGQVTSVLGNGDTSTGIADPLTPIARAIIEQTLQTYFPNYVPNANPRSGPGGGSSPSDPNSGTSPDPLKFIIPDFLPNQPYTVPIKLQGDGSTTPPIDVTFTHFNTAPIVTVAPVVVMLPVDKTSFEIKDQVQITDPDSGDVATPYVPGTAHIISASGPSGTPTSLDLKSLVTVDPQTGHVSYDPAAFKFLAAGQKAVYTIGFDSQSGPDTTHETLTFTVDGSNDAPVVASALTGAATQSAAPQSFDLLAGASDADLGETATLTVGNLKFALNGGTAQQAAPTGVTLTGTTLHVDPHAFAYLGEGQTATITVTYSVIDPHGASVAQTETITITGTNDAPVIVSTGTTAAATADSIGTGGVTAQGDIAFSDADLTDVHQITSTSSATTIGSLSFGTITSGTGDGSGGSFGWTYHADPAQAEAALLASSNGIVTETFTVTIADGHGGTVNQTITVTLAANIWIGSGTNSTFALIETEGAQTSNWNDPTNWSQGVPTTSQIVLINTDTNINLDVNAVVGSLLIAACTSIFLTTSGGAHTLTVSNDFINAGNIELAPGTSLEVTGIVQNTGTIVIDDFYTPSGAALVIDHTVTLEGGGWVTLAGSADRISGGTTDAKLINVDNTIDGYGRLGDGHLDITNQHHGNIIADTHYKLVIDVRFSDFINCGTIESNSCGGLEIKGDLVNYGTIEAYAGLFEIGGNVTGHGTAKISGGNLEFGGWSDANVTFSGVSSDELILDRGSHFVGTVSGLSYGDTIDLKGISPWQLWFDQHDGVVDVHYGWGKNDYFTLTDPGVLKHLDIDSDHHGGTEMTWSNDAPDINTSSAELSKLHGGYFKISDVSVWDKDWSSGENYKLDINGTVVKSGSLSSIDHYLEDGFTFKPTSSETPQATVAVTVTDGFGASEHVNFIFNTAPLQSNTQVSLNGTTGNDVIFATVNKDTLTGGHGSDQFVFGSHSGSIDRDIVTDFEVGTDKIVLDHIRGVPNLSGPFGDLKLTLWELSGGIEQKGNNTLIHLDGGDTLQLNNVHMSQLHASDFIVHPYSNVA
ncbi:VCBS domain-containing protein [Tardiphaga sp. 37S4]|uniref:VCBS domain-containing protein n=1 Tax=Tardiphaga sp. 37S4 TaxID=1404741 RepID=UPI001E3797B6|nr:VCBS domain-containing protein [Tardiphaga sp. 37S4]UFS75488.1 VCBS domain-containing protein [Tardiphaga sp. 37S4]